MEVVSSGVKAKEKNELDEPQPGYSGWCAGSSQSTSAVHESEGTVSGVKNPKFHVSLYEPTFGKSTWFFSKKLNQIFIKMHHTISVQFTVDMVIKDPHYFYVWATLAHSTLDGPVDRCKAHSKTLDPQNKAHSSGFCYCVMYDNVGHVLQSKSPDCYYYFDDVTKQHGVLVPISENITHSDFTFTCQPSCWPAVRSQPLLLVLTLQGRDGSVLAKESLKIKVCDNPERDMERWEANMMKTVKPKQQGEQENTQRHSRLGKLLVMESRYFLQSVNAVADFLECHESSGGNLPSAEDLICQIGFARARTAHLMGLLDSAFNILIGLSNNQISHSNQ